MDGKRSDAWSEFFIRFTVGVLIVFVIYALTRYDNPSHPSMMIGLLCGLLLGLAVSTVPAFVAVFVAIPIALFLAFKQGYGASVLIATALGYFGGRLAPGRDGARKNRRGP